MCEWAEYDEILWGFTKFYFKQILKVAAFYLEKKVLFLKKYISGLRYQNLHWKLGHLAPPFGIILTYFETTANINLFCNKTFFSR